MRADPLNHGVRRGSGVADDGFGDRRAVARTGGQPLHKGLIFHQKGQGPEVKSPLISGQGLQGEALGKLRLFLSGYIEYFSASSIATLLP